MQLVCVDALVWASWSVVVGVFAHVLPTARFERDTWLMRLRAWERDGHIYERASIRSWKDRLPEVGGKRRLPTSLDAFATETRRAEWVHWTVAALGPAFALWNPWPLTIAMLTYAIAGNAPFIAVQRYNRARVCRIQRRRTRVGAQ